MCVKSNTLLDSNERNGQYEAQKQREREKKEKIEWICITELWQNTMNELDRKNTQSNFIV